MDFQVTAQVMKKVCCCIVSREHLIMLHVLWGRQQVRAPPGQVHLQPSITFLFPIMTVTEGAYGGSKPVSQHVSFSKLKLKKKKTSSFVFSSIVVTKYEIHKMNIKNQR